MVESFLPLYRRSLPDHMVKNSITKNSGHLKPPLFHGSLPNVLCNRELPSQYSVAYYVRVFKFYINI